MANIDEAHTDIDNPGSNRVRRLFTVLYHGGGSAAGAGGAAITAGSCQGSVGVINIQVVYPSLKVCTLRHSKQTRGTLNTLVSMTP